MSNIHTPSEHCFLNWFLKEPRLWESKSNKPPIDHKRGCSLTSHIQDKSFPRVNLIGRLDLRDLNVGRDLCELLHLCGRRPQGANRSELWQRYDANNTHSDENVCRLTVGVKVTANGCLRNGCLTTTTKKCLRETFFEKQSRQGERQGGRHPVQKTTSRRPPAGGRQR